MTDSPRWDLRDDADLFHALTDWCEHKAAELRERIRTADSPDACIAAAIRLSLVRELEAEFDLDLTVDQEKDLGL